MIKSYVATTRKYLILDDGMRHSEEVQGHVGQKDQIHQATRNQQKIPGQLQQSHLVRHNRHDEAQSDGGDQLPRSKRVALRIDNVPRLSSVPSNFSGNYLNTEKGFRRF